MRPATLADLCESCEIPAGCEDPGWTMAVQYHEILRNVSGSPAKRRLLTREASLAVIRRARGVMQSAQTFRTPRAEPFSDPARGEIDLDASLDQWMIKAEPGPGDLIVRVREEPEVDIALMLDTSFSMTGTKLALSAVTAAVLACKSPRQRYCITLFQSRAQVIKRLREDLTLPAMVERLFSQTEMGYTNLEAALKVTLKEFGRTRRKGRHVGVILTDGKATAGGDPLPLAGRFDALHVIMMEDLNMDRRMCHRLADAGRGRIFALKDFESLPRMFNEVLRTITR